MPIKEKLRRNRAIALLIRGQESLEYFFAETRLGRLLSRSNTDLLRFWLSLCSFGYATWVAFDHNYVQGHPEAVFLVPANMQILLFTIHGAAVMYGVITQRYGYTMLLLEAGLGSFMWFGLGVAETKQQGAPGPMLIAGFIAIFLAVRYPTHYKVPRELE